MAFYELLLHLCCIVLGWSTNVRDASPPCLLFHSFLLPSLLSLSPTLHFSREQTSEQGRRGRGEERAEVWPQRATFCEYSASLIMMKTKPLEEYLIYSLSLFLCVQVEKPLDEAIKLLLPLQTLCRSRVEPHLLAYAIHSRRREYSVQDHLGPTYTNMTEKSNVMDCISLSRQQLQIIVSALE